MAVQKSRQPRYTVTEDIYVLGGLLGLATEFAPRLSDRLAQDFVAESQMVAEDLRNADAGQDIRLKDQTSTSGKFRQYFDEAVARLGGVHEAVRRLYRNDKTIADAFGLKVQKGNGWNFSEVLAGLDLAITAATEHAKAAENAKIRARDIEALKAVRANLIAETNNKQNKINDRRAATASKLSLQLEAERRIDEILAAARLEFATEPAILDRFTALIPKRRTAKKKAAVA